MINTYYISAKGYKKLEEDYYNIDKQIMETNKKMGDSVKRDNDLRENPEFMELRVKAMYELPQKKEDLWKKYQNAVIIEEMDEYKNFDGITVIIGAVVDVIFNGENCEYTILGSDEGNLKEGILSCKAPIAQALYGHKIGETIDFNGNKISILNIKKYNG